MSQPPLRMERDGAVQLITLDSRANRNALSRRMLSALLSALDDIAADDAVRAVVLRADGPAFCAGADLKEAASADADSQAETSRRTLALLRAIVALPVPVIAAVHGAVRAGGVGLVAACDEAIAAVDATFALTEVRLGLAPAIVSTVVLPRLSDRDASRLLLRGETFDGVHAAEIGLVTAAVPAGDHTTAAAQVAARLAAAPRQALTATKQVLTRAVIMRIDDDGPAMMALSARLFQSEEAQNRMRWYRTS